MMFHEFFEAIGEEILDAEEESFVLSSRDIPSSNLGFVDPRASTVEATIHGEDFSIRQSPTLLLSSRPGGTTGAVLWKITPPFAEWISSRGGNPFWEHSILTSSATVVELGCGISGLVALALGPAVRRYFATDQEYVRRLLIENLEANSASAIRSHRRREHVHSRHTERKPGAAPSSLLVSNTPHARAHGRKRNGGDGHIVFTALDWERDTPEMLKQAADDDEDKDPGFDMLISCDCIFNEALVPAFVRTCTDICRLRPAYNPTAVTDALDDSSFTPSLVSSSLRQSRPTICVIAQQQRSPDVLETWLRATLDVFHVWRLNDHIVREALKASTGYVVHALVLREKVG